MLSYFQPIANTQYKHPIYRVTQAVPRGLLGILEDLKSVGQFQMDDLNKKLDMSTARRHLKSPRSLSGTSAHPMVTQVNIMVMNGWLKSFLSLSIGRPIPEMKLFQTLTLKLQGQGHGCGQMARSYNRPGIILTHFLFISPVGAISKFYLETSKVKVMNEVNGQGHILYPVSIQCTSFSFHINRTNHSWDMAKIVIDLEKNTSKIFKENLPK